MSKLRLATSVPFALIAMAISPCRGQELFEAPPRATPDIPQPAVSDSVLTLTARIPYDVLRRATEKTIPNSFPLSGAGHIACIRVVMDEQCADYNWHATVTPNGSFQLAPNGDAIHLEQPLRINGQAGVGGDLARLLSLSAKNFEAQLTPGADIRFSMTEQWCPIASVTPTRNWITSAVVEAVGRNCIGSLCAGPVNVDLTGPLNDELNKRQGDISRAVQDALSCDKIRERIAEQWHGYSIPISLQDSEPPLFLNLLPTGANLSSLRPKKDALLLTARVTALTRVAPAAVAHSLIALPPLKPIEAGGNLLEVKAQAEIPYALLLAELTKALKGKDFEETTALGHAQIHVEEVDLYPSQSKVAFGMRVTTKIPGRILNTSGWVYAVGKPTVSQTGKALTFTDLGYATIVDNVLWAAAAELFKHPVLKALQDHTTTDLTKLLEDQAERFAQRINQTEMPGVTIKADTPVIILKSIDVGSRNLIANLEMTTPLHIEFTEALIAPN